MKKNSIGKRRGFSAIVIVLALLISVVPAGFFMAVLPVGAEQTDTGSTEGGSNNDGETTSETSTIGDTAGGTGSYIIYGHIYTNGFGNNRNLTPNALVIFTNMRTGDGNATYANETGYYSFDLAQMNNSYMSGDEIKITVTNGMDIMVTNMTIVHNSSEEIDMVIDPISDSMPRPHATPQVGGMPTAEPDLVVTNIVFSDDKPLDGDTITITATIENIGLVSVGEVIVSFYQDVIGNGYLIGTITGNIADYRAEVSVEWTATAGDHIIFAVIDPNNHVPEADETNNQNMKTIIVYSIGSLINNTIADIGTLKSKLDTKDKSASNHLDNAINGLRNALDHYTNSGKGVGAPEIPMMEQGLDDVWKAMETFTNSTLILEAKEITFQIIFISGLMVHIEPYQRIVDATQRIMETRTLALIELLGNNNWNVVDNKLDNANHHFYMVLKALAEDKNYLQEVETGYDKLLEVKDVVQGLVDAGKISDGFGNCIIQHINNTTMVFLPELSITSYDIVIDGVAAKDYETQIDITVHNTGIIYAKNVSVDVYMESETILISSYTITKLDAGASDTTTVSWTPTDDGVHDIRVVLDAENIVVEPTKEDNVVSSGVYILSTYATPRTTDWIITGETIVKDQMIIKLDGADIPPTQLNPIEGNVIITSNATSANLVGEKTINTAIKAGFISKESVIKIQRIPHAIMVKIMGR